MLMTPWLKRLARRFRGFGRGIPGRRRNSPRATARLGFERLEDRTLLATLTVNSLADTNNGDAVLTLREAMLVVNGGLGLGLLTAGELAQINQTQPLGTNDLIVFSPGVLGGTINLTGSLPNVTSDVQIFGNTFVPNIATPGAINGTYSNPITINANGNSIFNVTGAATDFAFGALNLTGGSASNGGAVFSSSPNPVVIVGSTISGNNAAGFASAGGGVYTAGSLVLALSTVSGNSATNGGGLYSRTGDMLIINSTISGNNANAGAGVWTYSGDIALGNSTVSGNMGGGGFGAFGGGLYTDNGNISIQNSTVTGNSAVSDGGISFVPGGPAGGDSLTIQNSIIAGNTAGNNADFVFVGGGATLTVQNSLIGDNTGTTLAATSGSTPDGNGNFVGTNGSPLNPLIGPLQNNGGPTQTHSLLSGSLAIDSGNNTFVNAGTMFDQRYTGFPRIAGGTVDMGAFEGPLSITGNTATVVGSSQNDSIVYRTANRTLRYNGTNYVLPANVNLVNIDGGGGKDTMNLLGTAGANNAITTPGGFQFEHDAAHAGFDVTGMNLEVVILDGQGGNDTVTLNDTAGDDKFFARPNSGFMVNVAGTTETDAFGFQMTGTFTTGNDLAKFFDGPGGGNETVTANPTSATLQGTGFLHTANNFDVLVAQSRNGSDVANAFGTAGNDAFTGRAGVAVLSSTGFNYQFDGFATVNADGLGGTDLVRFLGGAGNDTLTANPTSATFQTGAFMLSTTSFERLIGIAGTGVNDIAILTDSAGNDIFAGTVSVGELAGTGFFERAINFDTVTIRGVNGGTNRRVLNGITFQLIEQGTWI